MRRKGDLMCQCGHHQCDHIVLKRLPNGKKSRMGCLYCKCGRFLTIDSFKERVTGENIDDLFKDKAF